MAARSLSADTPTRSMANKPLNNPENRERLAREVVETFSMDDLVSFVINTLIVNYVVSDDDFQEDWKTYKK
jgi:hypothetical protein